ncbi:hypothetical protein, partial [Streptomyces rishiriensis]|uniref:hypothetical protein n=1 Tax=Streptomyces rishiriensis TaxID=68264 RepID=UPI0037D59CA1
AVTFAVVVAALGGGAPLPRGVAWGGDLTGVAGPAGAPPPGGHDVSDRIQSAGADEIFDFIENDLGIS